MRYLYSGQGRIAPSTHFHHRQAAGRRCGQVSASVLPPLREDEGRGPARDPRPGEHPEGTQS